MCKDCNDHRWIVWNIDGKPFVRHCPGCNEDGKLDPPAGQKEWLSEEPK